MGPLPNLVHYAAVAKGTTIMVEYVGGDRELSEVAAKCLEKVSPLHKRCTHTTKSRMVNLLFDDSFTYCGIADEALGKGEAYRFLENVKNKFKKSLQTTGQATNGDHLTAYSCQEVFLPVLQLLVQPLVGTPQKEKDRLLEEERLRAQQNGELEDATVVVRTGDRKNEQTEHSPTEGKSVWPLLSFFRLCGGRGPEGTTTDNGREDGASSNTRYVGNGHKLDVSPDGATPIEVGSHHVAKSNRGKSEGQQRAIQLWWRCVRIVLFLDFLVCTVLFAVWLVICKGFGCVS